MAFPFFFIVKLQNFLNALVFCFFLLFWFLYCLYISQPLVLCNVSLCCDCVDHSSYGECQSGLWQICSSPLNCTSVEYKSKCIRAVVSLFVRAHIFFLFIQWASNGRDVQCPPIDVRPTWFLSHRRRKRGQGKHVPPPKKKIGKIFFWQLWCAILAFFGQMWCKIWEFWSFFGQTSRKIRAFC